MSLFGSHHRSNSLFGSGDASKKVSSPHKFDWGAAAMSFLGVDPQLFIQRRRAKDEAAQQAQIAAIIDADPGLSPQDKAYAKLDPKAYIQNYMQRFQPMTSGPGGGSRGIPGPGGTIPSFQTAPRFDENGTIYGPGNGTSVPPILQRGTKAVPLQDGGHVGVVDSITGAQVMDDGSIPQVGIGPRGGGAPMLSEPPENVKAFLRQHPETADQFDQRYGPGAAARALGNGGASPSSGSHTFPGIPH